MAALGRPFTLGMLYDGRKDTLIPGLMLWDKATIETNTVVSQQQSSGFEVSASDSLKSKSFLLDVDASLEVSFMGGLIDVKGSAKYLNDQKKSHHQSRLTFQYKATTVFKQLMWSYLKGMDDKALEAARSCATHVVTGILYGANAFFVFDSEKMDSSDLQKIQGGMHAIIKKIPSFNIDGKVDIKLTQEEKDIADKFTCKFHGDFILDNNPATFQDAVKAYIELPKLLDQGKQNGVPMTVWMTPLKTFQPDAAEVVTGISFGLQREIRGALEDLQYVHTVCTDLLEEPMVIAFPNIKEKLSTFLSVCQDFRSLLERSMTKKLPTIREGGEDEKALTKVFQYRNGSLFSHDELTRWMAQAKREINVVRSCVEIMDGVKLLPDQSQLDREVLDPEVDDVLCFVFTSLDSADPYLNQMVDYLDPLKAVALESYVSLSEEQWFSSSEVVTTMRTKAKVIRDLAKALKNSHRVRILVASIYNDNYKGASLYQYSKGVLRTDNFSIPDIEVKDVMDRSDLLWYATEITLDLDTANRFLTLSEGDKKVTRGDEQERSDLPQRFSIKPQVLSRQTLSGRCYWEAEIPTAEGSDTAIAVCYGLMSRKENSAASQLGVNPQSWSLGHKWNPNPKFYVEHNNWGVGIDTPPSGCTRLGVYLDWQAGTLSYFNVSGDRLHRIHTFTDKFTEPLYVGLKLWGNGDSVFFCL